MHTIDIELLYQETNLHETIKLKFFFLFLCFSDKFGAIVLVALRMFRTFDRGDDVTS